MEGMSIELLTQLATEVLTSPEKGIRDEAAKRLRFMSCYDHWESVKALLPRAENNYLRFIVCKVMQFIVSNELGPQERRDMQAYVLTYLTSVRERGESLPLYVRNELYSIYAAAIYVNWRLTVISMEEDQKGMGKHIIDELSAQLPASDVLDCVLEVLTFFARQESKGSLERVRVAFAEEVLPFCFQFAAGQISSYGQRALEICCTSLENVPSSLTDPRIVVQHTTDDSVYLENGTGWFPALPLAVQVCARAFVDDPVMGMNSPCARFLRMASAVVCIDPEWFQTRNELNESFLVFSEELLALYESTGYSHILQLSCAILVNVFDRDKGKVTAYLYNRPQLIHMWVLATQRVLCQWEDGEEELRQQLMHMFFLFGECIVPRVTAMENGDVRAGPIMTDVLQVAQCYFDNVVAKAHLTEDSNELRSDVGVMLHNEKTLLPIAEMLFCERIDLYTSIARRLLTTIEQYESCVRAREAGDTEGLSVLMFSLAIDTNALCSTLGAADVPLFLTHVCLSRLSVIISAVAIAVLNGTANRSDEILGVIARFARGLLSVDDALTSALLESLSLFDLDARYNNGNNNNNNNGVQHNEADGMGNVHIGVLRSLFFFCGCVYESQAEGNDEFYEVMISLLRFVYVHHSDKTSLVMDANNILTKVLSQGVRGCFLASEKMTSILMSVKEERIDLLCATSDQLSPEAGKARSNMLTALTFFVESRHYAGYPTLDVLPFIITRALNQERLSADPLALLRDLNAIVDGIHQVEAFYWLLDAVIDESCEVKNVMRSVPASAPLVLRLCARLCMLATQLLREDNKCESRWGLASFAVRSIGGVMGAYDSWSWSGKEFLQLPTSDAVSENVVYDIADIMYNLICGHWCNLGVFLFYSDDFFIAFREFLSLFLSTSVELLMARRNCGERVFRAFTKAFMSRGELGTRLCELMEAEGLWQPLLRHLTKCLHYTFLLDILCTIEPVFLCMERCSANGVISVESEIIGELFNEIVVYIAVSPHMERCEMELCFKMLFKCFEISSPICRAKMDTLLDVCSAYHRVRLRHIYALLRAGKEDALFSYLGVFGMSSKVQTLSAW
ncbi:hypothetical protein DQ04_00191110 [Trypanosoma grayi]|uniref:hypothetical protein n=1 Tax=Trypanosoma grayi TaxID=71804 RepID=UPI0004F42E5E|nr:hypothetical protein DQ04_00191110 [Trypanosoma grayi]KEG15087.1 hypothetical protein DQ04_00191110 [Trypanosoma grayi]